MLNTPQDFGITFSNTSVLPFLFTSPSWSTVTALAGNLALVVGGYLIADRQA